MNNPMISQMIAADYRQRLTDNAAHRRLVAIAMCCRPSRVIAAARALRARLTAAPGTAACCA